VLQKYDVSTNHVFNCSNVGVLLILRRDYVTHPRNPAAIVRRKIANEKQLVTHLRRENPTLRIRDVQLDILPVGDQLKLVADSDVIIGMHGAGLTHTMFMPQGSGLIELMPAINMAANWHFRSIARWRNLVYDSWINQQFSEEEANGYKTNVPPEVVNKLLQRITRKMCASNRNLTSKRTRTRRF
jgi:glycoprotein 2-beta-D-xylosyltransferase